MLKKLLISIIFSLSLLTAANCAVGEEDPPAATTRMAVPCNDTRFVLNNISKKYGEKLVFFSDYDFEDKTQIAFFYNPKTHSYTVVKFMKVVHALGENDSEIERKDVACIVAFGRIDKLNLGMFMDRKS